MAVYTQLISSYDDGETIYASLFTNEFNQIIAAFDKASGHNHDGTTDGSGAPITTLYGNILTLGKGTGDVRLSFNASTNDGVLIWKDTENHFMFHNSVLIDTPSLGHAAGDEVVQLEISGDNANNSILRVVEERDSATSTDWLSTHKRIEFAVDVTRMSYIAQNFNGDYGLEIGSSAGGGPNTVFSTSAQPWISMKKAATGNGAGAVELYYGDNGTSAKKLETQVNGITVTGSDQYTSIVFKQDQNGPHPVASDLCRIQATWNEGGLSSSYLDFMIADDDLDGFRFRAKNFENGNSAVYEDFMTIKFDPLVTARDEGIITINGGIRQQGQQYNLFVRDDVAGSPALYVQQTASTGRVASFQFGSANANGGTEVLGVLHDKIEVTGTVEADGFSGTGSVTITDFIDDDSFDSASATNVPTSESVKAYVDAQVEDQDTLAEILAIGNTTGGTDIQLTAGDKIVGPSSGGLGDYLTIQNGSGAQGVYITSSDGLSKVYASETYVSLYHTGGDNAGRKLQTTNSGIDVTGTVTADGVTLGNNERITLGAESDGKLEIYEATGGNGVIEQTGAGSLVLKGQNTDIHNDANDLMIRAGVNEAALYHRNGDNAGKKLQTTNTGIDVTGTVAASDGLTADYIDLTGGKSTTSTGAICADKIRFSAETSDEAAIYASVDGLNTSLFIQSADDASDKVRIVAGGTEALTVANTGIDVTGEVKGDTLTIDNGSGDTNGYIASATGATRFTVKSTHDGLETEEVAGVEIGAKSLSYLDLKTPDTDDYDLRIYHSEPANHSMIDSLAEDLFLRSGGKVALQHAGANTKLETTATGINVTGVIDCDTSLQIRSTATADNDAMPDIYLDNQHVPADNQNLGMIQFRGFNDAVPAEMQSYAHIYAQQVDVSDGAEKGKLVLTARNGASYVEALQVTKDGIDVTGTVDLDNLTIATAQGTAGQVLKSTGSGIEWASVASGGGETLTQTLALGNATGGNDIVITDGDVITGTADPVIRPPAPSAGYGAPAIQLQTSGGFARIITTDLECKLFYGATAAVAALKLETTNAGVTVKGGVIADEIAAPNSYVLTTSAVMLNSQNWNGKQVWNKHAGNTTLTLATDAQAPVGFSTTISVMSSGFTMTLTPDTGDTIKYLDPVANTWTGTVDQNLVIGSGGVIDLIRTATSEWTVYGSGVV
jgi:hypothetical protein